MLDSTWLWALFTIVAAFSQTVRNAAQRQLTATLGTVGATHVRFLFGFPFALIFLAGVLVAGGGSLPRPGLAYWAWVADGALAQTSPFGMPRPQAAPAPIGGVLGWVFAKQAEFYRQFSGLIRELEFL
jgi:hypothetical protein